MDAIKIFFPLNYDMAHSLYKNIIDNPPENCEYITRDDTKHFMYKRYYRSNINKQIVKKLHLFSSYFLPPTYLKAYFERNEYTDDADIIYACSNFYLGKLPWLVDCEQATSFHRGHYRFFYSHKRQIEKILSRKNCKRIIPWTEKAKESVLVNYGTRVFRDKIEVVPLAIKSTPINYNKPKDKIVFLFVGSSNIDFKENFYFKGGLETIKAFKRICKEYDNTELVIRSHVDQRIRYSINDTENIKLIDRILPKRELEKIYAGSSIFVYPAFMTPGMAFVEAMNYHLPIITTDYWANSEYVKDFYNGFLVDMPKTVKPSSARARVKCVQIYPKKMKYHKVDEEQIEQISEWMKYFIENPREIEKMGRNSKKMVEKGKYSMEKKNKKLRRIYEECLKK